ncbi:MAG: hypothetical protein WD988_03950 [Candidatus Curtissbacteria bacterium]
MSERTTVQQLIESTTATFEIRGRAPSVSRENGSGLTLQLALGAMDNSSGRLTKEDEADYHGLHEMTQEVIRVGLLGSDLNFETPGQVLDALKRYQATNQPLEIKPEIRIPKIIDKKIKLIKTA